MSQFEEWQKQLEALQRNIALWKSLQEKMGVPANVCSYLNFAYRALPEALRSLVREDIENLTKRL